MFEKTFAANGEYDLKFSDNKNITRVASTTVAILENVDVATVVLGYKTSAGAFKAYSDGDLTTDIDGVAYHGKGVRLMLKITGITSNPVKFTYAEGA